VEGDSKKIVLRADSPKVLLGNGVVKDAVILKQWK
jgi:hypothetical protein